MRRSGFGRLSMNGNPSCIKVEGLPFALTSLRNGHVERFPSCHAHVLGIVCPVLAQLWRSGVIPFASVA